MDQHHRVLRLGAAVILCAVVMRLAGSGALDPLAERLAGADAQSFFLYLETGRIVRFSPSLEETSDTGEETRAPETTGATQAAEILVPCFSPEDAADIQITDNPGLSPDLESLLTTPLDWDLTAEGPTVLILHTHTTESYTKNGEDYAESSEYRTLDENYNMLSIGDAVAEILTEAGITVLHDRQLHDYPSYNGSYSSARSAIRDYLDQYPTIRLVLDLHRDASESAGAQMRTEAQVDGEDSAQLMFVVATGSAAGAQPHWRENLSLVLKLQVQLEDQAPGITRPINLRALRFNQDLSQGAVLVEVGAAGNTHAEALTAARQLALAIVALAKGSG